MGFSDRINELTAQLKGESACLITSDVNRFYFTGFVSSFGFLLIGPTVRKFFTDNRYAVDAYINIADGIEIEIIDGSNYLNILAKTIRKYNISTLGIEEGGITAQEWRKLQLALKSGTKLFDISSFIATMRAVKDQNEIAALRASAAICDEVFGLILKKVKYNMTEIDLAIEIEHQLRLAGADGMSFPTICAFGINSAKPHSKPTLKRLDKGDMILFDFGCIKDGYCSDFSRTVAFNQIKPELKSIYNIVLGAQKHALNAIRAHMTTREADSFAREFIKANGYGDEFTHSLGHGIGLEIHETPRVSQNSTEMLDSNMVISCEPGIYLNGIGGVRIEDVIVVGENGAINLTSAPKELIIL